MSDWERCPACGGDSRGEFRDGRFQWCKTCEGNGRVPSKVAEVLNEDPDEAAARAAVAGSDREGGTDE